MYRASTEEPELHKIDYLMSIDKMGKKVYQCMIDPKKRNTPWNNNKMGGGNKK